MTPDCLRTLRKYTKHMVHKRFETILNVKLSENISCVQNNGITIPLNRSTKVKKNLTLRISSDDKSGKIFSEKPSAKNHSSNLHVYPYRIIPMKF